MTTTTDAIEVKVPDIGDFSGVPVIEVHVAAGDTVAPEDPLVTLESDKATMDVPSPGGGVAQRRAGSVGDEVSEGDVILPLSGDGAAQPATAENQQAADVQQQEPSPAEVSHTAAAAEASAQAAPAAAPAPAPAG